MECKVCKRTNPSAFYSSIKTYCKDHWREKVRNNRLEKIDYYREFDRLRADNPERVEARKEYQKTEAYKLSVTKNRKNFIEKFPQKRMAHNKLNNALRDGKIQKQPCLVCGCEKSEAHHVSYDLPLDVVWLCGTHHKQVHKEHRAYLRETETI